MLAQLDTEHHQVLKDAEDTAANEVSVLNWYADHIAAIEGVLAQQHAYQPAALPRHVRYNNPRDSVWRAAKASGGSALLPQQVVIANSETEILIDHLDEDVLRTMEISNGTLASVCGRLPLQPGTLETDYAHADKHDLQDCLGASIAL